MDIERVAEILVGHIKQLTEEYDNDQELGAETRKFIGIMKDMKKEHDAHDAEIKRLINEN
jgi:tRNA-dihydrouridine synthase